ncbi:MAG: AMP-dependent synthetase/ligase [Betaproteobacteria bacterium]|nr:AMP-dependent synthetase/ligase [Betaproteobacteria bacterium]
MKHDADVIPPDEAVTLHGLFACRQRRTPHGLAYQAFDDASRTWTSLTWSQVGEQFIQWQGVLAAEGVIPGERVAIMLKNSPAWVAVDQAALSLGLVVVPLYPPDSRHNLATILADCGAKILVIEEAEHWFELLSESGATFPSLTRVLCRKPVEPDHAHRDSRLDPRPSRTPAPDEIPADPDALATIVYTSGTTGRPKGVMLTHRNILSNAYACLRTFEVWPGDRFLSFLPLSHTFERTVGYYLAIMAGATTAYARASAYLSEDLRTTRPTILIAVPRVYERLYAAIRSKLEAAPAWRRSLFDAAVRMGFSRFEHLQGRGPWHIRHLAAPGLARLVSRPIRARLGGRLRVAITGGAPLAPDIARTFIGLGLPVLQGYGLTEAGPVICGNSLKDNVPESVGRPIPEVSVRLGPDGVLEARGPGIMRGYYGNPAATAAVLTPDGWLNTGDLARIDAHGHVYITGRLKEILVMSNGEKVPPSDLEDAILRDSLFAQVMVLGDGHPFLAALAVVDPEEWTRFALDAQVPAGPEGLDAPKAKAAALARIAAQIGNFPSYARIRRVALLDEPWTVKNGLLTATLKLRRPVLLARFQAVIETLYAGHS